MPALDTIKRLGSNILDLVFPISCLICGKDGSYLCESCLVALPRLEKQLCVVCYKPSPFGKTHPDCVSRNTVDGAIAGLSYRDPKVKKIIEVFKYSFVSDLAEPLSQVILQAMHVQGLDDFFRQFTLVPVPLHQRRYNWRGFNQSELLAKSLAEKLDLPINNSLALRRKFTQPQTQLTADQRRRNLEQAFELTADVVGEKILLVDDVVTSGATAHELAKLFKKNKAAECWVISAAHG